MFDKQHLENFLHANGITTARKDEEIRSMLLSARWSNSEVDAALMILKENTVSKQTHVDTLHKVFRSDERLTPAEVTALLGVEMNVTNTDLPSYAEQRLAVERTSSRVAVLLSILIAVISVLYVMYREQAGFFFTTDDNISQMPAAVQYDDSPISTRTR